MTRLTASLPKQLRGSLPTVEQIETELEHAPEKIHTPAATKRRLRLRKREDKGAPDAK